MLYKKNFRKLRKMRLVLKDRFDELDGNADGNEKDMLYYVLYHLNNAITLMEELSCGTMLDKH